MNAWSAVAGGLAGILVLTTILRASTELRLTRVDLPFLLGTAVTSSRDTAKVVGYIAHFLFGIIFAFGYYLLFLSLHASGAVLGSLLGVAHGLFAGTVLVNVLYRSSIRGWGRASAHREPRRCWRRPAS